MNCLPQSLLRLARRAAPRGSALWYPYFYAKHWLRSSKRHGGRERVLFYVIHNNILLEQQKAIYFYIPKVACSSLKLMCAKLLDMPIPNAGQDLVEEIHLLDFPYAKKYKILRHYHDYFRFCFVRNPWARLLSCYKDKLNYEKGHVYERYENSFILFLKQAGLFKVNMSFDDFVDAVCSIPDESAEGHLRSQHTFITDEAGATLVNHIGKLESFQEDMRTIQGKTGIQIEASHLRKTEHARYMEHYNERSASKVHERYRLDIERFGYVYGS